MTNYSHAEFHTLYALVEPAIINVVLGCGPWTAF
jgi:hypothetical protein